MTNRDFKEAFTDILRRIFCWCGVCDGNSDDGFGGPAGGHGGSGSGGGAGSSMAAAADKLNVDYV